MEIVQKLQDIATHMDLEPDGEIQAKLPLTHQVAACGQLIQKDPPTFSKPDKKKSIGISHLLMPGGKSLPALKTMLTTACERNCYYCPFRAGRSYRRQTVKPETLAKTFMDMHRAGMVEGLFLSSGIIKGGVTTQDKLIETAEILRQKHGFKGYLHLKIMPGVEKDQVRRAMELANRLSVNLEAPNDLRLARLAPKKDFFEELIRPLEWIEQIRKNERPLKSWNKRWPSSVTQFVVGGAGESDLELVIISELLINKYRLQRLYYSAFRPIKDTPMENLPPEHPLRQHRLYQTSFLLRDYGFDLEELPFNSSGNLPLDQDPKLAWARDHLLHHPVEINQADKQELIRVPGLGPIGVKRILTARRQGKIQALSHLRQLGIATKQLQPFVLLDGKRPLQQLLLFDPSFSQAGGLDKPTHSPPSD